MHPTHWLASRSHSPRRAGSIQGVQGSGVPSASGILRSLSHIGAEPTGKGCRGETSCGQDAVRKGVLGLATRTEVCLKETIDASLTKIIIEGRVSLEPASPGLHCERCRRHPRYVDDVEKAHLRDVELLPSRHPTPPQTTSLLCSPDKNKTRLAHDLGDPPLQTQQVQSRRSKAIFLSFQLPFLAHHPRIRCTSNKSV